MEPLENRLLLAVVPGDILVADSGVPGVIQVDPTTGAQSTLSSGTNFVAPIGIAIDDVTGDIFVADTGANAVIRVDPNTGGQTIVSSGGNLVDPHGIEIEADGSLVVADMNSGGSGTGAVIRINRSTGAQTVVSNGGNFVDPHGITVAPDGTLYVADRNTGGSPPYNNISNAGGALIAVNPSTGAQTIINNNWGSTGFFDPAGVTMEASGDVLVADLNSFDGGSDGQGGGVGAVFRLDPSLPPATNRTIVNDGSGSSPLDFESPSDVAREPNGDILMIDFNGPTAGDEKLFRIDPVTGAASILVQGGSFGNPNGLDVMQSLDFGDAPDSTYPTLAVSNGARHVLGSGLLLGATVDAESDGQPDATATGDDLAGVPDDEDGVVFTSVLIPGSTANVTVTASAAGLLDAWLDFDNDGSWAHPGEQIFTSTALAAGANLLSFTVPPAATLGAQTFARFRLSTAGGLAPTGFALDGEVEDYALGSIHGQKFEDTNANGMRDPFEPGLNGFLIDLYDASGSTLLHTATTMDMELDGIPGIDPATESGVYWLPGLPPDDYIVRERPQNELSQTYPAQLGSPEYAVTVQPGQVLGTAPAEAEVECGPGVHWIDDCGTPLIDSFFDVFFSVAEIEVQGDITSPLGPFAQTVFGAGETRVFRSEPRESGTPGHFDTIDTEMLSMELSGSSPLLGELRLRAGADAGVSIPTLGLIQELGDPLVVDSFFNVFFEVDTPLGTLHNNIPMQVRADIEQVPPFLVGYQSQNSVQLLDAGNNPTGISIESVVHTPTFGVDFGNAELDFGDAPDPTYATLLANDGPRHLLGSALFLGASVDPEPDGQSDSLALGDDMDTVFPGPSNTPFPPGDEDGVTTATAFVAGQPASITVVASAPGDLDAWMDINGNGTFDHPAEHLAGGASVALAPGPNVLNFSLPANAVPGTSYARLRISSAGSLPPTGLASDGEVEDYEVEILQTGSIHGFKYEDVEADGIYDDSIDLPLRNVEFALTGTDVLGNAVNETGFTDIYGEFWFEDLVPGNYTVTEMVPAGFVATTPTVYSADVNSGEEHVAFAGQAMLPSNPFGEIDELLASDGVASDEFGTHTAIHGSTAVVTANQNLAGGAGVAYVFEDTESGWTEIAKLVASDAGAGDLFGQGVAISGDTVVVGALHEDQIGTDAGAVYIFERNQGGANNWGEVKKIVAPSYGGGSFGDEMGEGLGIDGDTLVVGVRRDDDNGNSAGAAYIFERNQGGANNWGQIAKMTASDGGPFDLFGASAAISSDTVVIGSGRDDATGDTINDAGAAYVYHRNQGGANNWGEVIKLTASDAAVDDFFGQSVDIDGNRIIVGASGQIGTHTGAAYIYEDSGSGWTEIIKLTASDAALSDQFGASVAVSGDRVMIGATRNDGAGSDAGAAYVFEDAGSGFAETQKLTGGDTVAGDHFGQVALDGPTAIAGASQHDDSGNASGSAYIFEQPDDLQFEVLVGAALMFGNTVPGSIHGFKYEDVDADGIYNDAVDLPLIGVDFTLTGTDGQGNVVNTTETTDVNGEFWFTGLLASVNGVGPATGYTVTETVPAGFVATTPTSYSTDLLSRQELVALPGQAMLPAPVSTTIDFDDVDAGDGSLSVLGFVDYDPASPNPSNPVGAEMDVDPVNDFVYMAAGFGSGSKIIRFDVSDPASIPAFTHISAGFGSGIAVDPVSGRYAATNGFSSQLGVFNPNTSVFDTESLIGCGGSVAAGTGTFAVSTQCSDDFFIYDQSSMTISGTLDSTAVSSAVEYNPGNGRFYKTRNPGPAPFFAHETLLLGDSGVLGVASTAAVTAANGVTNRIYVLDAGTITALDGSTHAAVAGFTPITGLSVTGNTAVDTKRDRLYVATSSGIQSFDASTGAALGTFALAGGFHATERGDGRG